MTYSGGHFDTFLGNLVLLILATLLCENTVLEISRRWESVLFDDFSEDGSRRASREGLLEV